MKNDTVIFLTFNLDLETVHLSESDFFEILINNKFFEILINTVIKEKTEDKNFMV